MPYLKYIWCIDLESPELLKYANVTTIKNNNLLFMYHVLTAKVIITNVSLKTFLPYRKDQIILNTWHGGGAYKNVGLANNAKKEKEYWHYKIRKKFSTLTGEKATYFISSCKKFSDVMHKTFNIENNKFLPIGMPRNDIFFNDNADYVFKIKNKLNIPTDIGILLYAPTHRSNEDNPLDAINKIVTNVDIGRLIDITKKKFKKDAFICLFRGHPGLVNKLDCEDMLNVSSYNDMQELLLIADILITDYSSCIWDFSLTSKPCFLFTPDLEFYLHDRGFYTPIEEWPFPLARTNDELCNNIINFDKTLYDAKIIKHHEDLGSYEQGTATSQVTQMLQEIFQ
jgi:CDP-glycerol glycerophosphotransferase